jgi:predicted lipid carrier protein YhbT
MGAAAWRGRAGRSGGGAAADLLMAFRAAPERVLTAAVRGVAGRRPEVFERLGDARRADFVIAPTDFPVAFRLRPDGAAGQVRVVRQDDAEPCAARITGPLVLLLSLLDGSADGDAAFFSRRVRIEGDTDATVALHNTLEAAELSLADLLGVRPPLREPLARGAAAALAMLRRHAGVA